MMARLGEVIAHPSPNFGARRNDLTAKLIVLHFTAMADAEAALERMCAPEYEVSAHYLIARDGRLYQLVEEDMRAWHAGTGDWGGQGDVNSRSIGIELDNCGFSPFAAPQMDRLDLLLSDIMTRRSIPPEGVIAHSDFAPRRKADPGARFDWLRLARQELSVWPEPGVATPDEAGFLDAAARFGYPVEEGLEPVLAAFRLRFRPQASGPLSPADMGAMENLAARFPIDRAAPGA